MNIKNLADILTFQVKKRPNKIAIYSSSFEITFKELESYVCKTAKYFQQKDIKEKDLVFHTFEDELLIIISMLALAKIGATFISVSKNIPKLQLDEITKNLKPSFLISDNDFLSFLPINKIKFSKEILFNLDDELFDSSYKFNSNSPWQIVISSGTTGKAKLFEVSHKLEFERIKISLDSIKINESDNISSLIELSFNSTKIRFLAGLYSGASYVLLDKKIENLVNFYLKYKVTILYTTVFHVENILKEISDNSKNIFYFLRVLSIGASNISDNLRERLKLKLTPNLYIAYGTNDIGGITCTSINQNTSQSVGCVIKGIKIEIVDENDKEKPIGEIGHIRVTSPGMINGYLNDEEATKKAFRNGWFYPGDLGKFTQDGELIYCGRSDHMMIMNGINIYPAQIENIITSHEAIEDAASMPIKHPIHQDIPICAVVLKKDIQISKKELMNYCIERLGFSSPREIVFLDVIPRNEQGKIIRIELNKMILENLEIKKENLKQTTREYKIELTIPNNISTNLINIWFKEVLNLKEETSNKHIIEEISQKGLILIQTLLEISQIPIFYHGKIKNINLNNNKYNIVLDIGYIDLIPNEFYIKIINFSFKYILWMGQNKLNMENKHHFYKICQEEIINHIQKNMPPGKSRIPILKTAFNRNIPFTHLGNGVYQLGWGNKSRKMDRSTIDTDSAMGSNLSQNKIFTANLLKMAGLPAPVHGIAQTKEESLEIALQLKYPVVVKPIDLDRGEGVTVDIYDESRLFKSFELAFNLSKSKKVIVEKQVLGVCHRLFIANNKLLYCVKRLAISVQADGINNISTLIDNANNLESNKAPWIKKEFYPKDSFTIEALKKVTLTLDSIPPKDSWIELRDIESTQWGGRDEDVTTIVHPDNLDIALRASKLFGLSVAGIDIITDDISKSWNETNAIINEVNFAPLLGGGEISKSCIPKFFDDFIEKDGRIPLEIFIGNTEETVHIAKTKQQEYLDAGFKCYLTNHDMTLDNNHTQIKFPTNSISNRTQALLLNDNVDALVLLIQNDEFLYKPIPFDKASKISVISEELKSINSDKNINEIEFKNLIYNLSR